MKRILVCALLIPLALAPVAHADGGINVLTAPGIGQFTVTVTNSTTGLEDCIYSAQPKQPSLLPPVVRNFTLGNVGQVLFVIPGMPTGTVWDVSINCTWKVPPPVPTPINGQTFNPPPPGHWAETITY